MTREERAWAEVSRLNIHVSAPTFVAKPATECPRDAKWMARNHDGSIIGFGPTALLAVEAALDPDRDAKFEETFPGIASDAARERLRAKIFEPLLTGATWEEGVRAWAVAGILYEEHQVSAIDDATYDELCRHLLSLLDFEEPEPWITEEDLQAGTAMGYKSYPKRFHDMARAYARGEDYDGSIE